MLFRSKKSLLHKLSLKSILKSSASFPLCTNIEIVVHTGTKFQKLELFAEPGAFPEKHLWTSLERADFRKSSNFYHANGCCFKMPVFVNMTQSWVTRVIIACRSHSCGIM